MNAAIPVDGLGAVLLRADQAMADVARNVGAAPDSQQLEALHDQMTALHEYVALGLLAPMRAAECILHVAENLRLDPAEANSIADRLLQHIDREKPAETKQAPLSLFRASSWQNVAVPERKWLVRDRIPAGNVTLLNGDGAAGKTTISLQLAVATVLGGDWLGRPVERQGPVVFLSGEEEMDEIQIRLAANLEHVGASFADIVP